MCNGSTSDFDSVCLGSNPSGSSVKIVWGGWCNLVISGYMLTITPLLLLKLITLKKSIKMNNLLVSENKFSKIFKIGEINLYVAKAFDEESNVHFIVCSIPVVEEILARDIQYPVYCQSEVSRDVMFDNFDIPFAEGFLDALIKEIKENNEKSEKEKSDKEKS